MGNALYRSIEDRYGFSLPEAYRSLEERGLLDISVPAHASAFYEPGSYLWLNDMEWYSLQDIVDFHFQAWQLPGFVPFAFTAGGDFWCWQPAVADQMGARVVCCFRDNEFATVYAPNFHTALYRQILDFCRSPAEQEDINVPAFLSRWAIDLAGIFPALWCVKLRQLADVSGRIDEATRIERTDIIFDRKDTAVRWMKSVN